MRIRFAVFVDEQRVPPELEPDEFDAAALHLLAVVPETGEVVGTARVVDKGDGVAKIGRVAVLAPYRGTGAGRALMAFALERVRDASLTLAVLDAQVAVIPFYERLGFVAEGPIFDDAGIPHRRMSRPIGPTAAPPMPPRRTPG
jgi:ElaA protein